MYVLCTLPRQKLRKPQHLTHSNDFLCNLTGVPVLISTEGDKNMEIKKSVLADIDEIMSIYDKARDFMAKSGNPNQWGKVWPPKEYVEQSIIKGCGYNCIDGGEIVAVFGIENDKDPWYDKIDGKWLNDEPYVIVSRLAVKYHFSKSHKDVSRFCTDWVLGKYGNIRADTGVDNIIVQNGLKKLGFVCCGKLDRAPYAGKFFVYQRCQTS
jgi:hypothetical protein